jgi:hypothetical protein
LPDSATRETEDAAFYKTMRFVKEECLDNSDDESETADEMPATAPKKKRAKKGPFQSTLTSMEQERSFLLK